MPADGTAATVALVDDWTLFCGLLGKEARNEGGVSLLITGAPIAVLNVIIPWRADADPAVVRRFLDVPAAAGIPHSLAARPGSSETWAALAAERGLRPEAAPVPLMVTEAVAPVTRISGLEMRRLRPEEAGIHAGVAAAGFGTDVGFFAYLVPPAVLRHAAATAYTGFVGGEPVTTLLTFRQGDHVGIYNVATPPEHRGQGYGAAITALAAREGFESGARFAYLQSSAMGYRVYERLGFRTVESWSSWVSTA